MLEIERVHSFGAFDVDTDQASCWIKRHRSETGVGIALLDV